MDINASRGMHAGATEEKIRQVAQFATSPLFVWKSSTVSTPRY